MDELEFVNYWELKSGEQKGSITEIEGLWMQGFNFSGGSNITEVTQETSNCLQAPPCFVCWVPKSRQVSDLVSLLIDSNLLLRRINENILNCQFTLRRIARNS